MLSVSWIPSEAVTGLTKLPFKVRHPAWGRDRWPTAHGLHEAMTGPRLVIHPL